MLVEQGGTIVVAQCGVGAVESDAASFVITEERPAESHRACRGAEAEEQARGQFHRVCGPF
jgi:hypothetical protein